MATTYTAVNNKGFVVKVTLDPAPTGAGQTIKMGYSSKFVYPYSYESKSESYALSYRVDGGNWEVVSNGTSVTLPNDAKEMQLRLSYNMCITEMEEYEYRTQTQVFFPDDDPTTSGYIEGKLKTVTVTRTGIREVTILSENNVWLSESISLNNSPSISGEDADLGEKSTAFNIEYSVNDTDVADAITVECYYDDELIATTEDAVRNQKYRFMISNEMLAPSPINSTHTIKIVASDGKGSTTRTYTFLKNRNPELYMDYIIKPVQTDGMAETIVVGQLAGQGQNFQVKVYVCNNGFDEQPMWEDMSGQYYQGLSYNFVNTEKTADKWGISVRFVNSKYNEDDQIDITGCGFWVNKMIVGI